MSNSKSGLCRNYSRVSYKANAERPNKCGYASRQQCRRQGLIRCIEGMRDKQVRPQCERERESERRDGEECKRSYIIHQSSTCIIYHRDDLRSVLNLRL